jgi:dipeptidyl aminopeptidase/acylaminoacyl peptidase
VEANRDDWGGGDFQDIMSGVDYLVDQKIADPARLGIGGWSYGGFMTSWAVTQTRRFKAAVVGAAVTNLFSFDGTTDITPSFLRNYFLNIPFKRRPAYDGHSAMTYLRRCRTPSLVLHGEADERVPVTQGWEFYNGLKMLGVPAEMVTYPREHHGFKERAHQIDLLTRVLAWYDKYLKN